MVPKVGTDLLGPKWGFHGYDYVAGQGPTALGGKRGEMSCVER